MAERTVARVYHSYDDAKAVVHDLEAAGLSHDAISLVANADAHGRSANLSGNATVTDRHETTEPAAGGALGAVAGTVLGGGAGLLAGIGALAIPGVGPVVAAGWLVATLTGAGIGAASGGLIGSLTGAGVSRDDAQAYSDSVQRGGSLVTVRVAESEVPRIEAIMAQRGIVENEQRAYSGSEAPGTIRHAGTAAGPSATPLSDRETIYTPDSDPARRL